MIVIIGIAVSIAVFILAFYMTKEGWDICDV